MATDNKNKTDQPVKPKEEKPKVDRGSLEAQKAIKDHQVKTGEIIRK